MDTLLASVFSVASVATLVIAIVAVARGPRTPKSTRAVIAQYTPPKNVSILLGGIIVGERKRSMAAQIVDLAVRGALRILAPLSGTGPYRVELVDKKATPGVVETQVLRAIFGNAGSTGQIVRINNKNATLSRRLQTAQGRAAAAATDSALIVEAPRRWRLALIITQIVLLIAVFSTSPEFSAIVIFAGIVTVVVSGVRPRALTAGGVELRDHLLGLREYISLAEADRMRLLQAPGTALTRGEIYLLTERLLGWAVLFGYGKEWAKALAVQAEELGQGSGGDVFIYSDFSGTFDGFAAGESDASLTDTSAAGDFGDSSSGGFDFGDASSSGGWGSDGGGDDGGGGDGGGGGGD